VWQASDEEAARLVEAFDAIPALYIADGHHRAASAARARTSLRGSEGTPGEWDTVLAVAFPDDQIRILPYNRVVRDLRSLTPDEFLSQMAARFAVRQGAPDPSRPGDVGMYLAGRWHTLTLGAVPEGAAPIARLDVARLQDTVLGPVLGIGDVRVDPRIDFVGGARGPAELERLVDSGAFAVGFAMHPVSIGDLIAISDAGDIMPPKSTWFEPKLRDGLLSHVI
jgi:uncharacterized protein (DUF1015 family)